MSVTTSITPYKHGGLGARVNAEEYRLRAQGEVANLLGDVRLNGVGGGVNLDAWSSHNAIKSGLAFELSGRATIVQARVASHLTAFDDPLKVLLPPQVVESDTIVVKRRIVTGHNAEVVPESAPARAVRVRTEEVEVTLNRYGCDIKMDTNLLAMPGATPPRNCGNAHARRGLTAAQVSTPPIST